MMFGLSLNLEMGVIQNYSKENNAQAGSCDKLDYWKGVSNVDIAVSDSLSLTMTLLNNPMMYS